MKTLFTTWALPALLSVQLSAAAQPDSAAIKQKALLFADSLLKTEQYENWSTYADLVPLSVIKYYGGKDGFIDHIRTGRLRTTSTLQEPNQPDLSLLSLLYGHEQWQFVIRMSRYFHKEDQKFHQITYFVGQSTDEGQTWRLFDASYNSVANIIHMMPDVSQDLPIPQPTILSEQQELALQQTATPKPAATQKKTPARK